MDVIVIDGRKPIRAVECKLNDEPISKALRYFKERFPSCDAWQVSLDGKKDFVSAEGIRAAPALTLLRDLA